jgi:hypothetical protein
VNETLSETVLTHAIRTPLMPNGLRTTLLTVQNAFVVLGARQGFLGKSTLSLGYPLEAKSAAYPFAPLIPATTRQGCLGSGVARPRSGFVPFGADQPWPEIRPADVCNPTCQRRTPGASRGYRLSRFPGFPLVGSVNDAVHAAIARLGWLLVFSPCWVLSPLQDLERLSL